ncbi:MAG: hypothetical protein KF770_23955 [Anaerolineae bacterium]|nr:hypothetical protein [Anaerolineae bacterium]
MTTLIFPYKEKQHPVFGQVSRPVLAVDLFVPRFGQWLTVQDVLADTGADLSVMPLALGRAFVDEVESGIPVSLRGSITAVSTANAFMHTLTARLGNVQFAMPVAIALENNVPPILGRRNALDRFVARFVNGEELILEV